MNFFGLTSETAKQYKLNLYTQIHEICFHGKGGFEWKTVYNWPRWLRIFEFNKINEFYKKEVEEVEKHSKGKNSINLLDSSGKIQKENLDKLSSLKKSSKVKYR